MRQNLSRMQKTIVVEVLLVKLSHSLHDISVFNLNLSFKQKIVAVLEIMEIYIPLFEKMHLKKIKNELQDICLYILQPDTREYILKYLYTIHGNNEKLIINNIITNIHNNLDLLDIKAAIFGRFKSPYSIWLKMLQKKAEIYHLYDILAFMIIVENIDQCYKVLNIIHQQYKVVDGQFADYICTPKSNGYQALHTVVIDPMRRNIEIQIRTHEMNKLAKSGKAAHWKYKKDSLKITRLYDIYQHTHNMLLSTYLGAGVVFIQSYSNSYYSKITKIDYFNLNQLLDNQQIKIPILININTIVTINANLKLGKIKQESCKYQEKFTKYLLTEHLQKKHYAISITKQFYAENTSKIEESQNNFQEQLCILSNKQDAKQSQTINTELGSEALVESKSNENFTNLDLTNKKIGDDGVRSLANSKSHENLTNLNLYNNDIDDDGARALAASPYLVNLTHLDLQYNSIGDDGVRSLVNSKYLKKLIYINLNCNSIGPRGIEALAELHRCEIITSYCDYVSKLFLSLVKEINNTSNLPIESIKEQVFKIAKFDYCGKFIRHIIEHPDKYQFAINFCDKNDNTLEHYYTNNPDMIKFLYEHGLVLTFKQKLQVINLAINVEELHDIEISGYSEEVLSHFAN